MIICGCYTHVSVFRTVRYAAGKSSSQTVDQIVDQGAVACRKATKIQVLAPVVRGEKGRACKRSLKQPRKSPAMSGCGWIGLMYELAEKIKLEKNKKHTIEIVIDRLVIQQGISARLADSIETAASDFGRDGACRCNRRRGDTVSPKTIACPGARR